GVQLALPPLARFLEVLMTSQIGENSCLFTLLLEPAKGTLEGFSFLHPDAGHPMNRLLTLVCGPIKILRLPPVGQHTPNTNQDTPDRRICQQSGNLRPYKEFRARARSASAAVSVV